MNNQELFISRNQLPTLGSMSLLGMAFTQGFTVGKITLVFETSNFDRCIKNDGPELVIIPDYIPFCIIECVLEMQKNGWDISIQERPT